MDFGSATRHHQLYAPWLKSDHCHAGMLGLRGAIAPEAGLFESAVREIKCILEDQGLVHDPVGIDIAELPLLSEMQRQGLVVRDAQQLMLEARQIKSFDEVALLSQAAAMVDGVYQDVFEALKPGVRENDIVALVNRRLYEMGSEQVEAVNAVSGERCNPHPHNFTDRIIRPGDQAFFDIIHSYCGYRTCYYRTLGVGRSTALQRDTLYPSPRMDGRRHQCDQTRRWHRRGGPRRPAAMSSASPTKCPPLAFSSDMALGSGYMSARLSAGSTASAIRWKSRKGWSSLLRPTVRRKRRRLRRGGSREQVVVGPEGPGVLTHFPAEQLLIANPY